MAVSLTFANAFRELMLHISSTHESYLCADELNLKIEYRSLLQNYIKDYLGIEFHERKFGFSRTREILRRSVQSNEFNVSKAAEAWSALSTYANNLFNQPWRKEYREIKLYSGFYKHQIESSLIGAESMLELMGYRRIGDRMVLDEPINRDCLIKTSLDALIAMCECQILLDIYEKVLKYVPSCTWAYILDARESYPGTAEQTSHRIISSARYPPDSCTDCLYSYPNNSYQPGCRTCQEGALKMQAYVPSVNGYCVNSFYPPQMSYTRPDDHLLFTNGHFTHVPTAKLIDLDDSFDVGRSYHHRKTNVERHSRYDDQFASDSNNSYDDEIIRRRERGRDPRKGDRTHSREEWGYVYRVLGKKDHSTEKAEPNYRSSAGHTRSSSRTNGISEAFNNLKLSPEMDPNITYFADEPDNRRRANVTKVASLNGAEQERLSYGNSRRLTEDKHRRSYGEQSPTWECSTCTYYNSLQKDVCEMCSKSRNMANEALLTSGGKHCSRCTLVNEREAVKCEACDANLENSPTYV